MFAVGVGSVSNLEEADFPFDIENQTSGTIMIDDKDGLGDIGITFWVKGTYEDVNETTAFGMFARIFKLQLQKLRQLMKNGKVQKTTKADSILRRFTITLAKVNLTAIRILVTKNLKETKMVS